MMAANGKIYNSLILDCIRPEVEEKLEWLLEKLINNFSNSDS